MKPDNGLSFRQNICQFAECVRETRELFKKIVYDNIKLFKEGGDLFETFLVQNLVFKELGTYVSKDIWLVSYRSQIGFQ